MIAMSTMEHSVHQLTHRPVRAYIATTGAIFALLALSHVARVVVEGLYVLKEPIFVLTTLVSVGATVWAVVLFKMSRRLRASGKGHAELV